MKILIVTDLYLPHVGGILRHLQRIAPEFVKNGNKVAFLVPSVKFSPGVKEMHKIKYYSVNSFPLPTYPDLHIVYPFQKNLISKYFSDFKPDIVHIHSNLILAHETLSVCKAKGIPVVATNHYMSENLWPKLTLIPKPVRDYFDKQMWKGLINFFNKFSAVTTPTFWGAKYLSNKGFKGKVYAISNGMDFSDFNSKGKIDRKYFADKYGLPSSGKILLYVGRIDKEKNIEQIIKAMKLLKDQKDIYLVLVGKGTEQKYLLNLSKQLGLNNRVIITGFVDNKDLPGIYKYADIFVISSTAELQSLVTLEAMASGLPVIAADAGALPELVKSGVNGFLFDYHSYQDLAIKIKRILSNQDLKKKMGNESINIAKKHDVKLIANEFEGLYCKLLAGGHIQNES